MSRPFTSDDQNIGASASASFLLVNIQGLSPLRLTYLISFLFKGLSGVFSSTIIQSHQFFNKGVKKSEKKIYLFTNSM